MATPGEGSVARGPQGAHDLVRTTLRRRHRAQVALAGLGALVVAAAVAVPVMALDRTGTPPAPSAAGHHAVLLPVVKPTKPVSAAVSATPPADPPMSQASTGSTPVVTGTTTAQVPLVVCPTTFATPQQAPSTLPTSEPVTLTASLVGTVALYSDDQGRMMLLGPSGWSCTAFYAEDSSGTVQVYPSSESPPGYHPFTASSAEAIVGSETGPCYGCLLGQACPLFSGAQALYTATHFGTGTCPETPPATEAVDRMTTGTVAFLDPPGVAGDASPSGGPYPANGVMTYYTPHSAGSDGSWTDTCTLPATDKPLCTASLDLFLADYGTR